MKYYISSNLESLYDIPNSQMRNFPRYGCLRNFFSESSNSNIAIREHVSYDWQIDIKFHENSERQPYYIEYAIQIFTLSEVNISFAYHFSDFLNVMCTLLPLCAPQKWPLSATLNVIYLKIFLKVLLAQLTIILYKPNINKISEGIWGIWMFRKFTCGHCFHFELDW